MPTPPVTAPEVWCRLTVARRYGQVGNAEPSPDGTRPVHHRRLAAVRIEHAVHDIQQRTTGPSQ